MTTKKRAAGGALAESHPWPSRPTWLCPHPEVRQLLQVPLASSQVHRWLGGHRNLAA